MALRIPFNKPFMVGKELYYMAQSVIGGHTAGDGPFTKKCHAFLEETLKCKKVLLTHSCTAALEIAAILSDAGPGDEVILPSFPFVSTANAFCLRGARPVFVDIDPRTLTLDSRAVEAAITPRTRAIAPVHYAGVPCDMDAVMALARVRGLFVVEDAAQALGSSYRGQALGTIGDAGAISFHETKNVISGEGGAVLINRDALIERAEIVREKGTNRSKFFRGEVDKYTWIDIGSSYLPSELIAAFLFAQLEHMDAINRRRIELYRNYTALLADHARKYGFSLPGTESENGHLFYILTKDLHERNRLIAFLKEQGVHAVFHYIPLHVSPMGKRFGYAPGMFPVTESVSDRLVRLPMYFELSSSSQDIVARAVERFYAGA